MPLPATTIDRFVHVALYYSTIYLYIQLYEYCLYIIINLLRCVLYILPFTVCFDHRLLVRPEILEPHYHNT